MPARTLRQHLEHMCAALKYSLQGIWAAASGETAFRQEIIVLPCLPVAAYLYGVPPARISIVIAGWLLVMAFELMNMAVESICNLVSPNFHPQVKIAKDTASAAVFLAILANAAYWLHLIWTY